MANLALVKRIGTLAPNTERHEFLSEINHLCFT